MLKNLKVAKKLGLAFLTTSILTFALGVTAIVKMEQMNDAFEQVSGNSLPSVQVLGDLQYQASSVRRLEAQLIITPDTTEAKSLIDRIEKAKQLTNKNFDAYQSLISNEEDRKIITEAKALFSKYFDSNADMVRQFLKDGTNSEEVSSIMFGPSRKLYTDGMKLITEGLKLNAEEAAKQVQVAKDAHTSSLQFILGAMLIAALVSAILAYRITVSITRPLAKAVDAAKHIAAGDLTVDVTATTTDEPGQMLASLQEMKVSLTALVNSVRDGADGVSTASSQIAAGNQDLSSRTESQASALQQTASSMEELSSTVRQNADNASEANKIANQAAQAAADGGQTVYNLVAKMDAINGSSKKIGDIISVIDTIAFQTNILALNAAVEAARAAEHGRGFAVVAGEVRALAQKSAAAAKEIKELIDESTRQVSEGVREANAAGEQIRTVVEAINRVAVGVQEISIACSEQASGVGQVGQAVSQMDQVTQQNAALVEEMAAAATSLSNQAKDLVEQVATFRT